MNASTGTSFPAFVRARIVAPFRFVAVPLILLSTIAPTVADQDESNPLSVVSESTKTDQSVAILPRQTLSGQPIRTLGMYQSQMDELIPNDFLPISIDRLIAALSTLTTVADDDQRDRLNSAVYWVEVRDDTLVSRRSEINIESASSSGLRRSLGPANFAVEPPTNFVATDDSANIPRLENESSGDLVAVFAGDSEPVSKIQFKWQLRGKPVASGYKFDLQLPRTAQTRIVISVPPEIEVSTLDGVLRSRSGPPPDADTFVSVEQKRWYELDAGGLNHIRLRTRPLNASTAENPWIVRNNFLQYHADPTGLNWICRMLVQPADGGRIPTLQFRNTTVSNINVNSFDVPFTSTIRGVRTDVQIDAPESVLENSEGLTTILIRGTSSNRATSTAFELPMPYWLGNVELATTVDQIQLLVSEDLEITSWELPDDWTLGIRAVIDDGSTMYAASGPPPSQPLPADVLQTGLRRPRNFAWSRVRFARPPTVNASETALRLELNNGTLTARARISVATNLDGLAPFRIAVEPEWNLDSIAFVHSSRVIEKPQMPTKGRILTLWPEATDIDRGEIVLELNGSRLIDSEASRLTIPATWFAAPHNRPNKFVAAILRPAELIWIRNSLVNVDPIGASNISKSAKSFLGDLPADALLFRPDFGRTPAVSLKRPIATFEAKTQFHILRDRDELVENLEIEIESSGEPLQQIVVQTGPSDGRTPYLWSLGDRENSPRIRLPKSAITIGTGKQDGIYTINLTDQSLRGQRLIGRRTSQINAQPQVHLPKVVGATSTRSFAWIDSGWTVSEKPQDIHTVFLDANLGLSLDASDSVSTLAGFDLRDSIGLRYDQSQSPTITLSKSEQKKHVAIVRREQVQVVASSRGVDRIEATYSLAPSALPLRIDFEPTLNLVSMSRNDSPVVLTATAQKFVTIPPRSEAETVRVTWNRDEYENLWLRNCQIPRISTTGIILRSEYELIPASDAFAPAVLLYGLPSSDQRHTTIEMQSGESVLLIRRNVVLATGWLLAMLVFAASWQVARFNPLILALACVVVSTAMFLWWPWKLGLIGWLMVPMIAAGMLATAGNFHSHGRKSKSNPQTPKDAPDSKASANQSGKQTDESSDFSVQTVFRLLPWLLLFVSCTDLTLVAQESENTQPESLSIVSSEPETTRSAAIEQSVDVLVPLDKDGKQVGSTVYIHQSLQKQFARPKNTAVTVEAAYQSAHYRVRIDGASTENRLTDQRIVEAEFLIHLKDGQHHTNSVRFPFARSSVRKIELLGSRYQLIIVSADTPTSVVARLPRGNSFRIRATLIAQETHSKSWSKISLPIPKVAASKLFVESDQDYDVIRLGGSTGDILAPTDPRRWLELIGPIDQLEIEYPANRATASEVAAPLSRRYVVDAGLRNISIDCQIDSTAQKTIGDTIQFILLDDRIPIIMSDNWDLERTEFLSSSRRRITVRSNHDEPGPIHLHWLQSVDSTHGSGFESYTIELPEIIANGQTETADAWIALRCDPTLQFAPLVGDNIEPLSIDHFNAAWKGHAAELDRAYVGVATIPSPIVQRKPTVQSTVAQHHHLHVTADQSLLRFHATLAPSTTENAFHCLRYPVELQVQELKVNGISRPFRPTRRPNHLEISLGDLRDSNSVEIQAMAILSLDDRDQFSPPHISIFPARATSDEYLISREPWIAIHDLDDTPAVSSTLPNQTAVAWLQNGWSPAMAWQLSQPDSLHTERVYQVETFPTDFNCRQIVSIDRQDGDWVMEANLSFDSDQVPDVIDVDLPTRWCDALQVEGALQWLLIDINDPDRQIIRIRYDKQSVSKRSLTIRGRLQSSDTSRLSVPSVVVLGLGQREVYVDIPNRSPVGESIQWQTNGVASVALPPDWVENRAASAVANRSQFVVTAAAWSIELAPLPEIDIDSVAFLFDCNVFSQADGAIVHASWDLSPGTLDSVDLRLPEGATLLAAWSAARAVETQRLDAPSQQDPSPNQCIRVPLAVGRLPQAVEVLLRISPAAAKQGNYIPELIGIPVTRRWLAHHVPKYKPPKSALTKSAISFSSLSTQSQAVLGMQRHLARALSIVDSVESIDRVALQSEQEIAMLLEQWRSRYQAVRAQAQSESSTESIQAQWADIDSRLGQLFLGHGIELDAISTTGFNNQSLSDSAMGFQLESSDLSGFQIERITSLNANQRAHAFQPESSSDRGLKTLIDHSLKLLLVTGLLVCLIPFYRYLAPLTDHPAFWLASMGVFGFAIAPIGVAGALVLLAIALPVFPAKRHV